MFTRFSLAAVLVVILSACSVSDLAALVVPETRVDVTDVKLLNLGDDPNDENAVRTGTLIDLVGPSSAAFTTATASQAVTVAACNDDRITTAWRDRAHSHVFCTEFDATTFDNVSLDQEEDYNLNQVILTVSLAPEMELLHENEEWQSQPNIAEFRIHDVGVVIGLRDDVTPSSADGDDYVWLIGELNTAKIADRNSACEAGFEWQEQLANRDETLGDEAKPYFVERYAPSGYERVEEGFVATERYLQGCGAERLELAMQPIADDPQKVLQVQAILERNGSNTVVGGAYLVLEEALLGQFVYGGELGDKLASTSALTFTMLDDALSVDVSPKSR